MNSLVNASNALSLYTHAERILAIIAAETSLETEKDAAVDLASTADVQSLRGIAAQEDTKSPLVLRLAFFYEIMDRKNENLEKLSFKATWFDEVASMNRDFLLFYFPASASVELFDIKQKRTFLKKNQMPGLKKPELNGSVTIYGRQMRITAYADQATERYCSETGIARSLLLTNYCNLGTDLQAVLACGLQPVNLKMVAVQKSQVALYGEFAGPLSAWNAFEPSQGVEYVKDALMYSDAPGTALFDNCACLVIRPHATEHAGVIVQQVLDAGFEISAMELFCLTKSVAEEFLEVYKGVLPEQPQQVEELSSGPALVCEVRQENVVERLRALVGPNDPELARHVRPKTLRAQFGLNRVSNAVHCTDLPEDGQMEVEYFFKILKN